MGAEDTPSAKAPANGLSHLFGKVALNNSDDAAQEWLEEARRRYDYDAEFHYRVKTVRQAMFAAFTNAPGEGHIAVVLLLDEKTRKANGLKP